MLIDGGSAVTVTLVVDLWRLLAELLDRERDVGVDTTVGLDSGCCCWVGQ